MPCLPGAPKGAGRSTRTDLWNPTRGDAGLALDDHRPGELDHQVFGHRYTFPSGVVNAGLGQAPRLQPSDRLCLRGELHANCTPSASRNRLRQGAFCCPACPTWSPPGTPWRDRRIYFVNCENVGWCTTGTVPLPKTSSSLVMRYAGTRGGCRGAGIGSSSQGVVLRKATSPHQRSFQCTPSTLKSSSMGGASSVTNPISLICDSAALAWYLTRAM